MLIGDSSNLRNIQDDSGGICNTLGNDGMCDSKKKVHMNMGPILNGYRVRSTLQHVHKCIEVGGGIFENLL